MSVCFRGCSCWCTTMLRFVKKSYDTLARLIMLWTLFIVVQRDEDLQDNGTPLLFDTWLWCMNYKKRWSDAFDNKWVWKILSITGMTQLTIRQIIICSERIYRGLLSGYSACIDVCMYARGCSITIYPSKLGGDWKYVWMGARSVSQPGLQSGGARS